MDSIKKQIERIIILVWGIAMTVGCQNSDITDTNEFETGELRFALVLGAAQTATRAGESDNKTLQIASAEGDKPPHIVIETYIGTSGSSLQKYFSDELGYFKSGNYWDVNSGKKRFLPSNGMNLYGFFATDFADKGNLSGVEYSHPETLIGYPKLTFTTDTTDALEQVDLIAAKMENITNPNILIPFRHLLSQINFGVKGIDKHQITVSNIRINNIYGKGAFDYNAWSWSAERAVVQSYPYYFPDRVDRIPNSGLGVNYQTEGTSQDAQNRYIFGDGGRFGPGRDNNTRYAQINPQTGNYATQEHTNGTLHNSLMLIPQEITKNTNATVTFDYVIKLDQRVVRSGENNVVRLDAYYDWKPNLRYVYLFDFNDPVENIKFEVLIDEWKNWDSDGQNNGIKNGSIQEPTPTALDSIEDGETIYLLGLLERELEWNWNDSTLYTFPHINTLTLDFNGVETQGYGIDVKVPTNFVLSRIGNRITIERKVKKLLNPTEKQLNRQKNNESFVLFGTLADDIVWNWDKVKFASLKQNEMFALDFTQVAFHQGKKIELHLPSGVVVEGEGVTGSNPYTVNAAKKITVTNRRVDAVSVPSKSILDVVSDRTIVGVNGGTVGNSGDKWDWSSYLFTNLDPQESFDLLFSGVTFNGQTIEILLPNGFRGFIESVPLKQNPYRVTTNSKVTIKNNKMNYPNKELINALSNGNILMLSGEKITGDAPLDWSSYSFPNLPPQASFTLDVSGVDFFQPLTLTLPLHFTLSGGSGINGSNPYTLTERTSIEIRNDKIKEPSELQLNTVENGNVIPISGGKLFASQVWDWSALPFVRLGRSGHSFTLKMEGITLGLYTLSIKLPPNCIATGTNVSRIDNGLFQITSGTGNVLITDNRIILPTVAQLNAITNTATVVIDGGSSTLQETEVWDFRTVPFTSLGTSGNTFTITVKNINFNSQKINLLLPGYTLTGGNVTGAKGNYLISANGTYQVTENSILFNGSTIRSVTSLTNGQTLAFSGDVIQGTNHALGIYAPFAINLPGEKIYLDFTRTKYYIGGVPANTYIEIWNSGYLSGYTVSSISPSGKATIHQAGNTILVYAPCIVVITKNNE